MTSSEKRAFWQKHFKDWQQSNLPQREYCKQHNLSFASFGYWRTRSKRMKFSVEHNKNLIPVSITRPVSATVTFPSGARIDLPMEALPEVIPLLSVKP